MKKAKPAVWLVSKIKKRVPGMILMNAAHVIHALLGVWMALGMRNVIDAAVAGNRQGFLSACLIQCAMVGGMLVCQFIYRHLRDRLHAELDWDWKRQLFHRLLSGDFEETAKYHTGELLNRLNNDVRTVDDTLVNVIPNLLAMACRLVGALVVLLTLDPVFALIALVIGIGAILATGLFRSKLRGIQKRISQQDGRVSGFLQEMLENLLMVQALDVAPEVERRADDLMQTRYDLQRKRKNLSLTASTGVSLLSRCAMLLALIWCAFRLLHGKMSFGGLTAVTQLMNQLRTPFVGLSGILPQYAAMQASVDRLMELDGIAAEENAEETEAAALYQQLCAIEAKNLSFAYDREQVLREVSFRIPKGSFCVITGQSGAGKSTILKLLLGIYRKSDGELQFVCEDGTVDVDRRTRKVFAYVPQGNLLLSGTIRENLCITRPNATEEEIERAVFISGMDVFLPGLPQGLDTVLGESGAGLSEGQAQRLSIARAVLSQAPILLLDEATSALDAETEKLVLERIKTLPNTTCIAVTHKQAPMDCCDWILEVGESSCSLKLNK